MDVTRVALSPGLFITLVRWALRNARDPTEAVMIRGRGRGDLNSSGQLCQGNPC